jgi:Flp pilus assembly pilin Flp
MNFKLISKILSINVYEFSRFRLFMKTSPMDGVFAGISASRNKKNTESRINQTSKRVYLLNKEDDMVKNLNDWMVSTYVRTQEDARKVMNQVIDNQRGAGAVEYALVIGAIVVAIVGMFLALGPQIEAFFNSMIAKVQSFIQ